ncbi:telomerase RNA component interacting RNase [Protopterus annectens]|uniref:telomerase RNA component interacting RNase n=1 Tax=Protopterus annectens TaxID=7888 RepID=UPI001CFB5528|nr:telomerase RNA component interacting RNase [Protopterus annectens]
MATSGSEEDVSIKLPSSVNSKREGHCSSVKEKRSGGTLAKIAKNGNKMQERKGEAGGLTSSESSSSSATATSDEGSSKALNAFKNDGSFLEFFKKKMEEEARRKKEQCEAADEGDSGSQGDGEAEREDEQQKTPTDKQEKKKSTLHFVGKRRGGAKLALKTGAVAKKQKVDEEIVSSKDDAWAKYLAEVKKYKAHQCSDDDKTRPLVK